jgi:hypothetical protein
MTTAARRICPEATATRGDILPDVVHGQSLPRIAVALIAAALLAWFVVLARDQEIGNGAMDRIVAHPNMSNDEWQRVMDDLQDARLLDPSSDWALTRANYLLLRAPDKARREAESIVRREPDNLGAWVVILRASQGRDPAAARRATREIERLNPSPTGAAPGTRQRPDPAGTAG